MVDEIGKEPPPEGENDDAVDEEDERIPGDWQDVKRYLIGLLSLVFLAVVLMFAVAIYEYKSYNGAASEYTTKIPAKDDVMRQGALPERLRRYHDMQRAAPSAAPSASAR